MKTTKTALTDLELNAVALVKKGANRRRFAFAKAEQPPSPTQPKIDPARSNNSDRANEREDMSKKVDKSKIEQVIKSALEKSADGEDKLIETLEASKLTPGAISAVVTAARALNVFRDELPSGAEEAGIVVKALGFELPKPVEAKPEQKTDDPESLEKLPVEVRKMFEQRDQAAKAERVERERIAKELADERKARREREAIAKAENEFSHVPAKTKKIAGLIMKASEIGGDFETQLLDLLAKTHEAVKKSSILKSVGGTGSGRGEEDGNDAADAYREIVRKAEKIMKSETGLSKSQAIAKAIKQNPALKARYYGEQNASTDSDEE